jgi:serine/threonine protein kinase/tetratricopeptide (TPR) repeat protein
MAAADDISWLEIDPFVEAYERCQAKQGTAALSEFLPEPDHPHFRAVLIELIRVDLEVHWRRGQRKMLEEHLEEFPQLRQDTDALREIASEEYRLRCRAGEHPILNEYHDRFGLEVTDWSQVHFSGSDPHSSPGGGLSSSAPGGARDALQLTALVWLHRDGAEAPADCPTRAVAELLLADDAIGSPLLGFQLIGELGRGSKSRVYLAQQQDLAGRKVVLKVSTDVLREPRLLAQLQHTHIVPIYSVHAAAPFQVFCMPYYGATTLADVGRALRQEKALPRSGQWLVDLLVSRGGPGPATAPALADLGAMTYVQSVLWLGSRLAEGLQHAHQRGIIHGDIKPANILLSDEGQPLLLDFNLAREVLPDSSAPATYLGGTLPYMPPEQLSVLAEDCCLASQQSDLYALGVVLCELLTGRLPYPLRTGSLKPLIAAMKTDREGPLPPLRNWCPALTPAEASIVRHCLAPDPALRYASAAELREDLERHGRDLPLRHALNHSLRERTHKWARRHPLLTSMWTMLALAALVVGAVVVGYRERMHHLQQLEAVQQWEAFQHDFHESYFLLSQPASGPRQRGLKEVAACLERYPSPVDEHWESAPNVALLPAEEREQLRKDITVLNRLRAFALLMEAPNQASQEAETALRAEARRVKRLAEAAAANRPVLKLYLLALDEMERHAWDNAATLLDQAARQGPNQAVLWFTLGDCHARVGHHEKALACFNAVIALKPASALAWYYRGMAHYELGELAQAKADFDESLHLGPNDAEPYYNRGLVRARLNDYSGALQDLDKAEKCGVVSTRLFFLRAAVRDNLGDREGANRDRAEGLRRRPDDADSWAARGYYQMRLDRAAALNDVDEALRLDPRCRQALMAKAQIVSEDRNKSPQERAQAGVKVLSQAIEYYPAAADFRASRGVLLARLGKQEAALVDAREALRLDHGPAIRYQVAGIYFLTAARCPEHRVIAYSLLALALLEGHGFEWIATDPELASVRGSKELEQLVETIRKVRGGGQGN